MIRICGETVSTRLSRRLHVETTHSPSFEKRDLFSKWMDRARRRIQKIVFCLSPKSVLPMVLVPFFPKKSCADTLDQISVAQNICGDIALFIGAVFSLFVSIFYQSSMEPASTLSSCDYSRDERRGSRISFFSSFLFLGLYQEVMKYLQNRIFVMEKSYV